MYKAEAVSDFLYTIGTIIRDSQLKYKDSVKMIV
jgi:hypothetical protein